MKRKGWVLKDVADPECVSGHMYRMAMITFLIDPVKYPNINKQRCLEMALVHDLAESIIGDITPHCGVSKEDKNKKEDAAMRELCDLIKPTGDYIYGLFREYEDQETDDARFVKDLDRFDLLMQAYEYEKRDNNRFGLQEFFMNHNGGIVHPMIKQLEDEIREKRKTVNEMNGHKSS